ncbi:MAG: cysteine desulfurase NifS [Candidatus Nanoarchaeia archaeon]|nr:cysteine desulfurase NifS [Candidatus Haiyanarchaeum thermophilum]MCW1303362.1 cysteine desulfurase NifS [Candidatus Haiyanarchaeum thermophilum]MCW1303950.1 cysteine desulfurase NifS [Candidatus Haiyanarchaeum thermophilum]MCW1306723.1 cysteine desulfurase NifS [Candidatus Haiyanarchaeum thermophilum]MCW1307562.1 cysteine desulfurase NifS [Candidatus Haiyanarchaeum thermophilum]
MKKVYMDYAATTPVDPRVFKEMRKFFTQKFGNTMSLHRYGREAKEAVEEAREHVAKLMGAKANEIIFTSGATEANNFALKGIALANKHKGKHIIISSIEHHSVIDPAKYLARNGFELSFLPVDKYGIVKVDLLEKLIRKDTILISVMHANNEIGTIEPIEEIGKICEERDIYFHCDAAQSFGKIEVNVDKVKVDLLTVSAHKLYGPKGVGAIYIREGTEIEPLLHGGGHEFGLRSSTLNVPGIVGFGKAVEIAAKEMKSEALRLRKLRDRLIKGVLEIPGSHLNGHPIKRLPNNANFWFAGVEGESLVMELDRYGIAASTGSACSSSSLEPSHVLLAIGLGPHQAHGSLRLTLGRWSSLNDVNYVLEVLPKAVGRLRKISPYKKW